MRQEIDRRIAEKEEEFESSRSPIKFFPMQCFTFFVHRKNHARAMDSIQASLDSEQKAKAEALRIKKKLEGDINELEIALDHANKANVEAQKVGYDDLIHDEIFFTGDQALPRADEGG